MVAKTASHPPHDVFPLSAASPCSAYCDIDNHLKRTILDLDSSRTNKINK